MSPLIPPRPRYKREHALFGYPVLASFLMLFATRVANRYFGFQATTPLVAFLLPVVIFLLPALIFIRVRGRGYTRTLRLHRLYAAHIPLLICALLALFSGCVLLSILFGGIDSLGNSQGMFEEAVPRSVWEVVIAIPVLGVLPALLEELLFRGVLCTELDRRGTLRAILLSSLLFSLIHFDLLNLAVYFFAGVLLSLSLYATDSLPATMLLHVCYNLLSLFGHRFLNAFYQFTGSVELFLFFFIILLLLSLFFFCRECVKLYRMRDEEKFREPRRAIPADVQLYTMIDACSEWSVGLCVLLAIVGFIVL